MNLFTVENPIGHIPVEERRKILSLVAAQAKAKFEEEYPKLTNWFADYDALYLLSFCAVYMLSYERGTDPEAVNGKLDFAMHHLEILQAISLMMPRSESPLALGIDAERLQESLRNLTEQLALVDFEIDPSISEGDLQKKMVLSEMKGQSLAIRNHSYPEQSIRHLKSMFGGKLDSKLSEIYDGISIVRVIETLDAITKHINENINRHVNGLKSVFSSNEFETCTKTFLNLFPKTHLEYEIILRMFQEELHFDIERLKHFLTLYADLLLSESFIFSVEDFLRIYGDISHEVGIRKLLNDWSYSFADLQKADPKHFLFTNTVLSKPFIRLENDRFFWVLSGEFSHTLPTMLEQIIPPTLSQLYMTTRSNYLEETVENLARKAFPDANVFRGSQWRESPEDTTIYENDILIIIDSTAIVIECKAHQLDASARRGGDLRLISTLKDVVVSSSLQSVRFANFIDANKLKHSFPTARKAVNEVNTSDIIRTIPLCVTYENLGFVSADLKKCKNAGLIPDDAPLVPCICFTDLEIIFELLESQSEKIHYIARRAEIEKTMSYMADELDLLAFYLDRGFNIGEAENGEHTFHLVMKSKELDPYFMGLADGVQVKKPRLKLTKWWRDILGQLEKRKSKFWTEAAFILLSTSPEDQKDFEKKIQKLSGQIKRGTALKKHNWVLLVSGNFKKARYGVIGYIYRSKSRDARHDMASNITGEAIDVESLKGVVLIGSESESEQYPYNLIVYASPTAPPNVSK